MQFFFTHLVGAQVFSTIFVKRRTKPGGLLKYDLGGDVPLRLEK